MTDTPKVEVPKLGERSILSLPLHELRQYVKHKKTVHRAGSNLSGESILLLAVPHWDVEAQDWVVAVSLHDGDGSWTHIEVYADQLLDAKEGFEICPTVTVSINDDLDTALYPVKAMLGFYIGGMGSAKRNFHKELMARMGFPDEAEEIQRLFMEGERDKAIEAVPAQFADEISLCGPRERIKEKLQDWENSPVTSLLVHGDVNLLRDMAELVL